MPVVEGHLFAPGDLSCLRASSFKISLVPDGVNPTSTIIEGAAGDQYEVFSSSAGKVSVKCLRLFGDHDTKQAKGTFSELSLHLRGPALDPVHVSGGVGGCLRPDMLKERHVCSIHVPAVLSNVSEHRIYPLED